MTLLSTMTPRRRVLRGMLGGTAVTVGLPLLNCFLNTNGTALANGAPLPRCFGTWAFGLGYNPGYWEPKTVGAGYEISPQLKPLEPFKDRLNIYSGLKAHLDGRPAQPHGTGQFVITQGVPPRGRPALPSIDSLVADSIGTATRFRSLEVACDGTKTSLSQRGDSLVNASESSPAALYTRIFGPEFVDPNAADFKPNPRVMVRRSALSLVSDQRKSVMTELGAEDRIRLDAYFTSLRELEQQLALQLQKPPAMQACVVPAAEKEAKPSTNIDDAMTNHMLFAKLLANALACGQTNVINVVFSSMLSTLRKAGSANTFHILTHEEAMDPQTGVQPESTYFMNQGVQAFADLLQVLDSIKEGDGTLLDRIVMMTATDTGFAKLHSLENIPILTAGRAGGRLKTGIHFHEKGGTVARVGLTLQQALGMPVSEWGIESNSTSKPISEILA